MPDLDILATHTPLGEIVARMTMAVLFGAVVGFDREVRQKAAGLRTHMLIALAAAVFTLLTFELTASADALGDAIRADPVRVTEAVVTGVAFLGAGTIIRAGGSVHGITTGASIWMTGAVGTACGGGFYVIAGIALAFVIFILTVVGLVEARLIRHLKGRKAPVSNPSDSD
ncbi:MAG: MgtC/SapB family protein [Alphaproteobacteria bacterium]